MIRIKNNNKIRLGAIPLAYLEAKLGSLDGSDVAARAASDDNQVQFLYDGRERAWRRFSIQELSGIFSR
jgi:hypothetical protein